MSQEKIAYIYENQQLLVDHNWQLPKVSSCLADIRLDEPCTAIARQWNENDEIPNGFQFVSLRQLIPVWDHQTFEQASRAVQLLEWKKKHRFCSQCGTKTRMHHTEHCMVCPNCHYRQYPRISPCIITIITHGDNEVLLAKSIHRKDNVYGLIAGFVEVGETLEQAVARETLEEVGVHIKNIRYLASQPWPFPSNLMLAFHAEYADGDIKIQEDEIADAQFFKQTALPEVPHAGSIAHRLIMHITQGIPL